MQASQMMPNYLKKKTQIHKMTKDCNFRLITGPIKRPKNWASNILHTSKEAKRSIQNKTGVNPDETFRKN